MPRLAGSARRLVIWFIWAILSSAPARLTFRPSASPNHRWVSASVMRSSRLSRIWVSRSATPRIHRMGTRRLLRSRTCARRAQCLGGTHPHTDRLTGIALPDLLVVHCPPSVAPIGEFGRRSNRSPNRTGRRNAELPLNQDRLARKASTRCGSATAGGRPPADLGLRTFSERRKATPIAAIPAAR